MFFLRSSSSTSIVPANFSGNWQCKLPGGQPADVSIRQTFQNLDIRGTAGGGKAVNATLSTVRGDDVRISAQIDLGGRTLRHDFAGKLRGDSIEGTVRVFDTPAVVVPWVAQRTGGRVASLEPGAAR